MPGLAELPYSKACSSHVSSTFAMITTYIDRSAALFSAVLQVLPKTGIRKC